MRQLPTYHQAAALPGGERRVVPAEFGDPNGHLNVRHYLGILDDAEWVVFARFGLDAAGVERSRRTLFGLEQHLTYHREVLVGDEVSGHMRLLDRTGKLLHAVDYLVNHTRREVAAAMELLYGYADLDSRRLVEFEPGPTLAALDADLAVDHGWDPELNGCTQLRH